MSELKTVEHKGKVYQIGAVYCFDKQVDGESKRIANIIYKLENTLNVGKLKIQFSAGEDVKAACGMFI